MESTTCFAFIAVFTVHPVLVPVFEFIKGLPLIGTLTLLMGLDMIMGILVAINKRTLNSTLSFRGMTKKVFMMIIVAAGAILEPFAPMPVAKLISFAYIITEAISITENAAAIGVPIPQPLQDVLQKLREDQQKKTEQKSTVARVEIPMTVGATTEVVVTKTPVPSEVGSSEKPK